MVTEERLNPSRRLWIGAVAVMMAGAGFLAGRILLRPAESVPQPIEFNHQLHIEEVGLDCRDCHQHYETAEHSGLPSEEVCLQCHEEKLTDSPEEQKLLELARSDAGVEFRKLFRMPDHVYYSHRRHVVVAGLECEICHGDIANTTAPPSRPLIRITMDTCVDCHNESDVRTDCTSCHR